MKRSMMTVVAVLLLAGVSEAAPVAAPHWYTISFTGADMFNYTTTVAARNSQDAPRRRRDDEGSTLERSDWDANFNGTNDFAEWAQGSTGLATFGFSYFNLWGDALASSWGQSYQAVPNNNDGTFGVGSWRNQTVNGAPVHSGMGSVDVWDGGIVLANQTYNEANSAWPVWRSPLGTQVTMANAASLVFSVDVLMQNYDTAFEPNGQLKVYFGGFNAPQGSAGSDVSGVMMVPEPATMTLLALGGIATLIRRRNRRA